MKIKVLIIGLLALFFSTFNVEAKEIANINIKNKNIIVGDKITLEVTIDAEVAINEWEFTLDYDKSKVKLLESPQTLYHRDYAKNANQKDAKYTYYFEAINFGKSTFSLKSISIIDKNYNIIETNEISKEITIISKEEKEESLSKNNNLKSITIKDYALDFNKDWLEYNIEVEKNTQYLIIDAIAEDELASIRNIGKISVVSGLNRIEIEVEAENKSKKVYVLNVFVKGEEPVEVTINNKKYTIVMERYINNLPNHYLETTINIDGKTVNAYRSNITKLVLVNVKDELGNILLYQYKDNRLSLYTELSISNFKIMVLEFPKNKIPSKYMKKEITLLNKPYVGYIKEYNSTEILIYAMNLETGKEHIYVLDRENNRLKEYNPTIIKKNNKKSIIIITSVILLLFSTVTVIIILKKRKRKMFKRLDV